MWKSDFFLLIVAQICVYPVVEFKVESLFGSIFFSIKIDLEDSKFSLFQLLNQLKNLIEFNYFFLKNKEEVKWSHVFRPVVFVIDFSKNHTSRERTYNYCHSTLLQGGCKSKNQCLQILIKYKFLCSN